MTRTRRILRKLGWTALILLLIHFVIEISGHHYLYPTVQKTLFRGLLGPDIEEYKLNINDTIKAGNPQPWQLASNYNNKTLSAEDEQYHQDNESVSFLVISEDQIVFEQYWEHFDETTLSNSFSMAKSIVALLVGIAIDRGEIESVDKPLYWYLPQYETELGKEITIKHLLTMSSGIDFDEDYLNPFAFPARANYGDNLELLLTKYQPVQPPGVYFDYQSGNTQLLAFVLRAATRKTLPEYASEHVWKKIGFEHDAPWSVDREGGIVRAFCCINSPARDFARIGKLYMQHGRWNGEQIVDSAYVAASINPPGTKMFDGAPCVTYGYQWWMGEHAGNAFYFMRGLKGQYVFVVPDKELIVVRMGRKRKVGDTAPHPEDVYRYFEMGLKLAEE